MTGVLQKMKTAKPESEKYSFDKVCPLCGGSGWEAFYDGDGRVVYRDCKCGLRQKQINEGRLKFANIPENFKGLLLKNFRTDIYTDRRSQSIASNSVIGIKTWLNGFEKIEKAGLGLYIFSEAKGTGKTRMLASIANELVNRGIQVKFATSLQILQEIKSTWNKDTGYSEHHLLNDLSNTRVLVIDDFGVEQDQPWINERFLQILNERCNSKKITIFSSNIEPGRLKYDERIIDRLKECTMSVHFPENGVREVIGREKKENFLREVEACLKEQI